jgi:phosphoglycolate phosphatase
MKTLIFDFDGTIADSFELVLDIAHDLMGLERFSQDEIDRLRGMPIAKIIRELHIPMRRLPRLVIKGRQRMHERIHEVHPFPGMPEVLHALHDDGFHLLVISSNSERNVRTFLRANNLESYFDGVYGGVAVFNKSNALRKVLRRNQLQPADCFYIGDEVRDVVAATKSGVEPVAVAWGYQTAQALTDCHPFALAKEPVDLLRIFRVGKV